MTKITELYKSGDFKNEKHVPAIDVVDHAKKNELIVANVCVGKDVAHPNTTEHHISWISVYFIPEDGKFAIEIGKFDFNAHGESAEGPNTSTIYTNPCVTISFKTDKTGTLIATSYCNIHGLWESSQKITIK